MPLGTSPGVSKACSTSPTVVVGDDLHLYLQGCAATGARSCVGIVTLHEKNLVRRVRCPVGRTKIWFCRDGRCSGAQVVPPLSRAPSTCCEERRRIRTTNSPSNEKPCSTWLCAMLERLHAPGKLKESSAEALVEDGRAVSGSLHLLRRSCQGPAN